MHLDLVTIASAEIAVVAVLAGMLLLVWGRAGWSLAAAPRFVGSWGLAAAVYSVGGSVTLVSALAGSGSGVVVGTSLAILSAGLKWHAARLFAGGEPASVLILLGPAAFLMTAYLGTAPSLDDQFAIACSILAIYGFAAAFELIRMPDASQSWPAVTLLVFGAGTYLSWVPTTHSSPLMSLQAALTSNWLPFVVLMTLLLRVALAFIVLSMAKDRDEEEQRRFAHTDSLTGLPNRRALFDVAEAVVERRLHGGGTPVSLIIADLDHFKDTNDTFGHSLGDDVLRIFARVVRECFDEPHTVGRLGGEEFAVILPGIDSDEAVEVAEQLREKYCWAASFVNGLPVGSTVSIGVATDNDVDSGLSSLFRRADAALYAAKSAGRDRVVFVGRKDAPDSGTENGVVRTSPTRLDLKRVPSA